MHTNNKNNKVNLKEMLFGAPLLVHGRKKREKQIRKEIDAHLRGLLPLLPLNYGISEPCDQALVELKRVINGSDISAKRCMLLYSLAVEPQVLAHWQQRGGECAALAVDLNERVLPFTTPRYFRHCCQAPDAFVALNAMLASMWAGEKLGNWPNTLTMI